MIMAMVLMSVLGNCFCIVSFLALCGCASLKPPPQLVVVRDASQIGGKPGVYNAGFKTIYLAPGATWDVLEHELDHHYYGSLGEVAK